MSLSIKYRKTRHNPTIPPSWEIKLPDVLWINIYKFLAGDIRRDGIEPLVLAAKDIEALGQVCYGMRAVIARELLPSLFSSFKPLVEAIGPLASNSHQRAKQAIHLLTKISYEDKLHMPLLRMTGHESQPTVPDRVCPHPLYILPLFHPAEVNYCQINLHRIDQPLALNQFRPDTYMPPVLFCRTFNLLMNQKDQTHICNSAVKELGGKLNVAPFLPLEEAFRFLSILILHAVRLNSATVLGQFTTTEQGIRYLLDFKHENAGNNLAHTAAIYERPDILQFCFDNERLRPLLFERNVQGSNLAHIADVFNEKHTVLKFLLNHPQLRQLLLETDAQGNQISHHADAAQFINVAKWHANQ